MNLVEESDAFTMRSCRFVVRYLSEKGLPRGETIESVGELVGVHRNALHQMKQRTGKGTLVLELGVLAKTYPDPTEPKELLL